LRSRRRTAAGAEAAADDEVGGGTGGGGGGGGADELTASLEDAFGDCKSMFCCLSAAAHSTTRDFNDRPTAR